MYPEFTADLAKLEALAASETNPSAAQEAIKRVQDLADSAKSGDYLMHELKNIAYSDNDALDVDGGDSFSEGFCDLVRNITHGIINWYTV